MDRRKNDVVKFYRQMGEWKRPDILMNPIGTLVLYQDGAWITAPWIKTLSRAVSGLCERPESLVTGLTLPIHELEAERWNLIMLESGISALFGVPEGLWPVVPPLNGILFMNGMAFPHSYKPLVYIDCIPERIINTLNKITDSRPEYVIYWRPSDPMIETMESFGIPWLDQEEELLDFREVFCAGQPEDVVSILSEAIW